MKKLISLFLIMSTAFASASTADDNEIMITQTGDTLILYIDQLGFGNKIGLNDFSSGGSNMTITGASLGFNIDMIGDQNKLFGPVVATNSTYDMIITGNSNSIDWNIGYIGSSTYSDMDFTVTGNSNTFDLDQGYAFSAERLNADVTVLGSGNAFDIDWEADDLTFTVDIDGIDNDINTLQKDGAYSKIVFSLDGNDANVDIIQTTGTCVGGSPCANPISNLVLDVTSNDAIIQINQKDSAGDS
jgi:hypothetical protein|tara:strand:- start:1331 stop:2062 length:732 start_codon:yes stop_codon:yes gene_type:complete